MLLTRLLGLIFLITAVYIVFKVFQGIFRSMKSKMEPGTRSIEGGEMVQDPVCGIYIPKAKAIEGHVKGESHFFCSPQCLEKYRSTAKGGES